MGPRSDPKPSPRYGCRITFRFGFVERGAGVGRIWRHRIPVTQRGAVGGFGGLQSPALRVTLARSLRVCSAFAVALGRAVSVTRRPNTRPRGIAPRGHRAHAYPSTGAMYTPPTGAMHTPPTGAMHESSPGARMHGHRARHFYFPRVSWMAVRRGVVRHACCARL